MTALPPALPNPNKGLIQAGWICIAVAVGLCVIPLLNIVAAMFGGFLLLASFVISIILLTKEETRIGLIMLLVSLIGAPITMVILFLMSNLVFAAIVGSTAGVISTTPSLR